MKKGELNQLLIDTAIGVYKKASYMLFPLRIYGNNLENINDTINKYAMQIDFAEAKISSSSFNEFINAPQINDLLNDCLLSLILSEVTEENNRIITIADNCIIYCLEAIQTNFPNLSDNNSVWTIKKYIEYLFRTKNILREVTFQDGDISRFFHHAIYRDKFVNEGIYERSVKKVEDQLSIKFTYKNNKYENVKNIYHKALRQIYQNGFIYLVGDFKFNEFYIPPILFRGTSVDKRTVELFTNQESKERYKKIRENWRNIFRSSDIIYVIGGAGYGKSLFLRNIVNNYIQIDIEYVQDYLLIYCDLKTFYSNGNANKKTIIDFLQESMITITGISDVTQRLLQYFLNRGRCIVLLDALDEVPKEVRKNLHKKIIAFFSTCNPNNKICITSRDRGFIPQEKIEVFHIFPLVSYDIEDYLDKMININKFKKENKETFMKQAQTLIDKNFLNNFLVLSLLVNIYKSEKELPENKVDLYKKCFDYIAKKREEEKSKIGYNWDNIYPIMKDSTFISLSTLAAPNNSDINREDVENLLKELYSTKYSDEAEAECAIKEFLEFCSNRTELFVPSAVDDKFKFFHRSFFEYFYARYIYQQSTAQEMYELMTAFDIDSEVFELTVALVKEDNEKKYQELLDYMFKQVIVDFSRDKSDLVAFGILSLAMQVIDDRYYINKYYDILIGYSYKMKHEKVSLLNQRLLQTWLQKGIGDSQDKKEKFKKIYETECIKYALTQFSYIKRGNDPKEKFIFSENKYENDLMLGHGLIERGVSSVPFFALVYQNYYDIYSTLKAIGEKSFQRWLGAQRNLSKKERNRLKSGISTYNTLKEEDCKKFLELLFR